MSILKIVLYVAPFFVALGIGVVALGIGWSALGIGLTGGIPEDVSPITMANVLAVAAILTAMLAILTVALNVGWIVAYNRR